MFFSKKKIKKVNYGLTQEQKFTRFIKINPFEKQKNNFQFKRGLKPNFLK
jgi:hypothetical protein